MSKATMIVTVMPNPDEGEAMQEYSAKAGPILGAAGGTLVNRFKVAKPVVGDMSFAMVMIMEFPDAAAIEDVFASDDYQALVPIRDKAFKKFDVVIAEGF